MSHLDSTVLHGVEHLQTRNDFTARKSLDLEFVVGGFGNEFCHHLDGTPQRVERFRPARRQAPFDLRHRLRDCRCCHRGGADCAEASDLDKVSPLHRTSLPAGCVIGAG